MLTFRIPPLPTSFPFRAMSARFFLPARLPLCAGLLYLALPLLLFLQGWVHPAFSAPLCAALACGLYVCARHLPAQRLPLSGRRLAALGLLSFFCLMLVLLCGFTGHCQQHADFIIRNAVYERLAANSWPLVTEDGHHFIYYLGHWLPPALAASFCPASWAPWLLALWTFLGLELALLAATVRWGIRKTARWALILLCLGSPAAVPDCLGIPLSSLFAEYHAQMVLFIGMPVQLFNTFNHAVPALLCAVFVLTRSLPPSGYYLAGTLLLPSSPLGALLLLPYMAYETLFRLPAARKPLSRLRSLLGQPVFWLAALCTAVMAVFYSHLDGGGQFSCLFDAKYAEIYHYGQQRLLLHPDSVKYASFLLALALGILLPGALLFPKCRKNPLYYITLGMMAGSLFFRTGIMNNELLFKAPAVLYPFLSLLFLRALRRGDVKYRALLILYLVFSALPNLQCIMEKAETFSTRASIMRKHWQTAGGTPDCPGTLIRRQFMKKDGHPLPSWLFKTGIKPQSRQQ